MTRFYDFTEKINHIDFHENSDKLGTIESLRNLLIAECKNFLETLDIVPLPIRRQVST